MRAETVETAARLGGADPAIEAGIDGLLGDVFGDPIATCAELLGRRTRAPLALRVSGDRIAEEELAERELAEATDAAVRPTPRGLRLVRE